MVWVMFLVVVTDSLGVDFAAVVRSFKQINGGLWWKFNGHLVAIG